MKKALLLLAAFCGLAAAQDKLTVAVYMAGEEPPGAQGVRYVLGGELARTISTSGSYTAVDRTEAILDQLAHEHTFQRSGAVSDEQIKSLGQQLGVQYMCIANINPVGSGSYYLDVRLVDVVTAEIIRSVTANSSLKDAGEMTRVARSIAYELIESEKAKEQRERLKQTLFYTSIGLDAAGAGMLLYGIIQNGNVRKHSDSGRFADADRAASARNAALVTGTIFLLGGISIHIFF